MEKIGENTGYLLRNFSIFLNIELKIKYYLIQVFSFESEERRSPVESILINIKCIKKWKSEKVTKWLVTECLLCFE